MSRLPTPGRDDGTWGTILNEFLEVAHNNDGTLRIQTDGTLAALYQRPADGIPVTDLATSIRQLLEGSVQTVNGHTGPTVTLSGADLGVPMSLAEETDVAITNPANNQVLTYNGTHWINSAPGSGAVTSVAGKTGAITLVESDIANLASDLSSKVIVAGDLSGNASNPTVAKINGISVGAGPSNGQVLTATSGTAASWQTLTSTLAADTDVNVSSVSDGQLLSYSQTSRQWVPVNPAASLPPSGSAGGDLSGSYPNPLSKARTYTVTVGTSGSSADYVCDGTADDVEINAAITAVYNNGGGTVFIKAGNYNIANPIVPMNNMYIRGDSMFTTSLNATSTLSAGIFDNYNASTTSNPTKYLTISDLELNGLGFSRTSGQYYKGINSRNWQWCKLFNIYCHDCTATGIGMDNLYQSTVDRCIVINNGTAGMTLGHNGIGIASGGQTAESFIVSNCFAYGNADNDYLVEADGSNTGPEASYMFINNVSSHAGQDGMRNTGTPNVSFINNVIYSPAKNGIYCTNAITHYATNCLMENNIIIAAQYYGIYQGYQQTDYIIQGNIIRDGQMHGIICGASGGVIANNHVHDNGYSGIFLGSFGGNPTGLSNVMVSGNTVSNNAKSVSTNDGINLNCSSNSASNITITGNHCFDNQATPTQRYGIILPNSSTYSMSGILVTNNNLNSNLTGPILVQNTSSGISVKNNAGVNPENVYNFGNTSGAITVDRSNGNVQTMTLTGDITPAFNSAYVPGDTLTLEFIQDATGGHKVTWPANVKLAKGGLTLSTAASAIDFATFVYLNSQWHEVSRDLTTTLISSVDGETVTIPVGSGNTGLTVTQHDTTNNPDAVDIANTASGTGLRINQTGQLSALNYALLVDSSGTVAQTNSQLVRMRQQDTASTAGILLLTHLGTGPFMTAVNSSGTVMTVNNSGQAFFAGSSNPTANLHLAAGTAAAGTAPLKLTAGTNLTTPEAGAIEFDGSHFYGTINSTRYQLDQQPIGSATSLVDANGNPVITSTATTGAVAYLNITNAVSGGTVTMAVTGGTSDNFVIKGSGTGIFAMRPGTDSTSAWRVQSSGGTSNVIVADTTNSRVGIGVTAPNSPLQVAGSIASPISAKTASYTLSATDSTVLGSGNITLTLPSAASITGRTYTLKKTDASGTTVTIATSSSQTIDGASSIALTAQNEAATVQSDGTNWWVIAQVNSTIL